MSDLQRNDPSDQNHTQAYLRSTKSRGERRRKAVLRAPPHAEHSGTATISLETDLGGMGVEDRPRIVTDR
jgi:hypothetical protein